MTSVQQVEQVVRIAKELGRKVASADEARQMLKIGTWYDSPDETLASLGLPPNRKDGQLGFIVKETDGTASAGQWIRRSPDRGAVRHQVAQVRESRPTRNSPVMAASSAAKHCRRALTRLLAFAGRWHLFFEKTKPQ